VTPGRSRQCSRFGGLGRLLTPTCSAQGLTGRALALGESGQYNKSMATNDDMNKALLLAGLIGLGAMAYTSNQRRREFDSSLREQLQAEGLEFISAELGRGPSNEPVWMVTLTHPFRGLQRYSVSFAPEDEPYAIKTMNSLVGRILTKANVRIAK
jgi:hypothetical protein